LPKPSSIPLNPTSPVSPAASAPTTSSPPSEPPSHPRPASPRSRTKRIFPAAYKLQIVEELKGAPPGKIAEVLRREGLYHSHLSKWRHALGMNGPDGLLPKKTGRPSKPKEVHQVEQLLRKNEQLERELAVARKLLELQKKVSEILGLTLPESEEP
jgi:transposase